MKQHRLKRKKELWWWLTKVYWRMKNSSKTRWMEIWITKEELKQWAIENNIQDMLNYWIENDCIKDLVPSVNRLDDYINYSLDNIELVTWKENNDKWRKSIKTIEQVHNKLWNIAKKEFSKKVEQRDINWNIINTYKSVREAGRQLWIDYSCISKVCRWEIKTYFNNQFNYVQ